MSRSIIHAALHHTPADPTACLAAAVLAKQRRAPAPADIVKAALAPRPKRLHVIQKKAVVGTEASKQIVYCVCLEPGTFDLHKHIMDAEEIEYTAHEYMKRLVDMPEAKMIKSMHDTVINAYPVESYIAPQDLVFRTGTYGPQVVKKGSWVLGIKVLDTDEWAKVVSGEYTGISVGGEGMLSSI